MSQLSLIESCRSERAFTIAHVRLC